jgi:hypothetical protein
MQRNVDLIFGPTGSGKTYLADRVIKEYPRVLIADAAFGEFDSIEFTDSIGLINHLQKIGAFPETRVSRGGKPSGTPFRVSYTPLPNERDWFFELALELGTCLLVLEEADRFEDTVEYPHYSETIVRGRHDGVSILAIGLRPSFLPKDLRTDVTRIYCFGQMRRPNTLARDRNIVKLYQRGEQPKAIALNYHVSVWSIYRAIIRIKKQPSPNIHRTDANPSKS